jgi:hypothetical protein
MMPIISTKRLQELVNKAIEVQLDKLHNSIALSGRERVEYLALRSDNERLARESTLLAAQNERLVQANREHVRTVNALEQILHGTAQEEVRQALNNVVQKIRK